MAQYNLPPPSNVRGPSAEDGPLPKVASELGDTLGAFRHAFVISDPSLPDCPIEYASDGFCALTGYTSEEIVNRNCKCALNNAQPLSGQYQWTSLHWRKHVTMKPHVFGNACVSSPIQQLVLIVAGTSNASAFISAQATVVTLHLAL
eukprot:jgi/Chlat1/7006/Chrsp56S06686